MAIISFNFDPALTEEFVRFGYEIYQDDAFWIPPFKSELYAQMSQEFFFYKKQGNECRHFLAMANKKVLGRVSAIVNNDLKDRDNTAVGTVGFFECVDDFSVARDLLDTAIEWLYEKRGINRVWGPMNFDIWHGYRFMTKGFGQKPFYGEPRNKGYYPDFFIRYNFVDRYHWDSVEITGRKTLENMTTRGSERYRLLVDRGYRFEHINLKQFHDEMKKLYSVLTLSFQGFVGYTPVQFEEFERLFEKMRYAVNPRLFIFIFDESNNLVGFAGAFLDLADAVRSMAGKETLLSKLKFLYNRRRVDRINCYIGGMTSQEAAKRSGLGRAAFSYILREILNEGYETILHTLRLERNPSRGMLGKNPPDPQCKYALYEWNA